MVRTFRVIAYFWCTFCRIIQVHRIIPAPPYISLYIGHRSDALRSPFVHWKKCKKMEDNNRNQPVTSPLGYWRQETTPHTDPAYEAPPPLITKKWLACRFNLMHDSGNIDYKKMYRKVLTPEVIQAMGSTVAEIRSNRLRTFTRQQTNILIKLLEL